MVLALANAHQDSEFGQKDSKKKQEVIIPKPHEKQAQKLVRDLTKHAKLGQIVQKMNDVSIALIDLAHLKVILQFGFSLLWGNS